MAQNIIEELTRDIFKRIDEEKEARKMSDNDLLSALNLLGVNTNRNTMNDWRTGKSSTFIKYIGEIATVFEMEVEDLTRVRPVKQIAENSLTDFEETLLYVLRSLDSKGRYRVMEAAVEEKQRVEKEKTDSTKESAAG